MRNFRCQSNDLNEFSPSASAAATTLGFANVERTKKNLQNKNPAGSAIECVSVEAKPPPLACMFERHFPNPEIRLFLLLLLLFTTPELGYDIVA